MFSLHLASQPVKCCHAYTMGTLSKLCSKGTFSKSGFCFCSCQGALQLTQVFPRETGNGKGGTPTTWPPWVSHVLPPLASQAQLLRASNRQSGEDGDDGGAADGVWWCLRALIHSCMPELQDYQELEIVGQGSYGALLNFSFSCLCLCLRTTAFRSAACQRQQPRKQNSSQT